MYCFVLEMYIVCLLGICRLFFEEIRIIITIKQFSSFQSMNLLTNNLLFSKLYQNQLVINIIKSKTVFFWFNKINFFLFYDYFYMIFASNYKSINPSFTPVIGLFHPAAHLQCEINPQAEQHHFCISVQHPLEKITKITLQTKKHAFQQILRHGFDIKTEEKTIFLPEALLTGKRGVMDDFKRMLQKGKINSYIKLNMRHTQVNRERKKVFSLDQRLIKQNNKQMNQIDEEFNSNTLNQKTTKRINSTTQINQQNQLLTAKSNDKSFLPVKNLTQNIVVNNVSKLNQENNIHVNIHKNVINEIHHHKSMINHQNTSFRVDSQKSKKSKSKKKDSPFDGIRINYIEVKKDKNNPETSTYIYKSTGNKSTREVSQFGGGKTEIQKVDFINDYKYNKLDDLLRRKNSNLSFLNNEEFDKISIQSYAPKHSVDMFDDHEKNIINNEFGQLFQNQLYNKNYVISDRRILKKQKKTVYVDAFGKKDFI